jgi:tRNA nucleotidyltransferase/poly(A) polymerase
MLYTKYEKFLENQNNSDMFSIIPDSVKDLLLLFKKNGKKLYVVGGAVRDFLIGDKPKDFDLATDATPDEVYQMLTTAKYKSSLQGKAFGVVVVYTHDQPMGMEIATFREDLYDSKLGMTRNPDVKFTTIENDVKRRDIPFNALFFDLENRSIVDLVGGVDDIRNKVTRLVGDANLRIEEDPLRILRVLRFAYRYDFRVDERALDAIRLKKSSLKIISKERIWEEFKKAFSYTKGSKDFNSYLYYFNELNLWEDIFPNSVINTELIDSSNLVIILANLFRTEPISKLESKMVQTYKIETDFATKVVFLISLLSLTYDNVVDLYKQKVRCHITDDVIKEWLRVNLINDSIFYKFLEYKPSVDADDLMDKGFRGKNLGDEIKRLEIEKFKSL